MTVKKTQLIPDFFLFRVQIIKKIKNGIQVEQKNKHTLVDVVQNYCQNPYTCRQVRYQRLRKTTSAAGSKSASS